jgi:peptidoglycan/xylan/chitin deacetylase (PgdA/CDA1 family)
MSIRTVYYHSIVDRRDGDYYSTFATTVAEFRSHVRQFLDHGEVLSAKDVIEIALDQRLAPSRCVHITFDDGFANNIMAAEILSDAGLPWTLFTVVDSVLEGFRPWYIRLADSLAPAQHVASFCGESYDLSDPLRKWALARKLKELVLDAEADHHLHVLDTALSSAGLAVPDRTRWPFLDIEALKQLRSAGAEIGCHTATHPNLQRCTPARLDMEIRDSAVRLTEALEARVRFFSYPDGRFDAGSRQVAASAYDLAFATEGGTHRDRHSLVRYAVPPAKDISRLLGPDYPQQWRRARRVRIMKARLRWLRNALTSRVSPN